MTITIPYRESSVPSTSGHFASLREALFPFMRTSLESSQQAWKQLIKFLQCVPRRETANGYGRLRSRLVSRWRKLVGISIGSAQKCFRRMNEQDTPGTISSSSTSTREESRDVPLGLECLAGERFCTAEDNRSENDLSR